MDTDVDEFTLAIARILKARQQDRGPSYTELAIITGLARPTVERKLNGRRDITAYELRALCGALGLDPAQVIDEAEASL